MKNSYSKPGKILKLGLLTCLAAAICGCSILNKAASNTNQSANANVSTKTFETPNSTPKVAPPERLETPQMSEIDVDEDQFTDNTPKGKLDDKITQPNFDKINDGMSLAEVSKIFEDKGMKISDMTINGRHSEMFMWSTGDFKKKIRVTFEKEKVVEKEKDGF